MVSNIEYILLLLLTFLSLINSLLPILLKPIWMCFFRQSNREKVLYEEIFHLKAEQLTISMKDNFAAHAKLQRKINKLQDEQKECSQNRRTRNMKVKLTVTYVLQLLVGLVMFAIAYWYRYTPLLVIDNSLFPYQNMFSYPNDVTNSISPLAWVIISRMSFSSLLEMI